MPQTFYNSFIFKTRQLKSLIFQTVRIFDFLNYVLAFKIYKLWILNLRQNLFVQYAWCLLNVRKLCWIFGRIKMRNLRVTIFFWFFINTIWRQILTKFWFLTRFSNYKFTSKQRETVNLLVFMSKFKIEFKSRLHCKDKYDDECMIKTLFYLLLWFDTYPW